MKFINPLRCATLIRRYKRFLADVQLPDGEQITVHCPNTGAMTGCAEPGMTVWLSEAANPKRKYRYTWELAQTADGDYICVNTQRANQVVGECLAQQSILTELQAEQRYADNKRIDWLASTASGQRVFIEVKSVTLKEPQSDLGLFPDTQSVRAQQHLQALIEQVRDAQQAWVIYCGFHTGIKRVQAAAQIDPKYAQLAAQAEMAGVQFYFLPCRIDSQGITAGELVKLK